VVVQPDSASSLSAPRCGRCAPREAIHREDVDAGVDWHFIAFRASNAVMGVAKTVQLLDHLVKVLDRGSEDLVKWKPGARTAMNHVLNEYESSDKLVAIDRAEPVVDGGKPQTSDPGRAAFAS
jgi:hypothetical protein